MNLAKFKKLTLGHFPTPLEPMERLSSYLGGPRLLIKRDDCTGLASGGNKVRKLEYLLADAVRSEANVVITQGAVQSNHARQTAAACARLGLRCVLLLEARVPNGSVDYQESGNVLLDRLFGAELRHYPQAAPMAEVCEAVADELRGNGMRPYVIPGGGSNALGSLGYAACVDELYRQSAAAKEKIDHIVVASGSAGTHAGMVAGLEYLDSKISVHGISVKDSKATQIEKVLRTATDVSKLIGSKTITKDRILVDDRFVGPGYGISTPEMIEAISLIARYEGLLLDPVYSGKAMAGLLKLIKDHKFEKSETVVFLHTGGSPGLFAYRSAFDAKLRAA